MGLKIGQVAQLGGVNLEAVRYYERQGFLDLPPRLASGYRMFPDDTVARIRFIKRAQELGFSLVEIKELLSLRVGNNRGDCGEVLAIATAKLQIIEKKIHTLEKMRAVLTELTERCPGCGPSSECPILLSIDAGESIR
jgi:MerR family mercuric resistance operon transcriptional regulator